MREIITQVEEIRIEPDNAKRSLLGISGRIVPLITTAAYTAAAFTTWPLTDSIQDPAISGVVHSIGEVGLVSGALNLALSLVALHNGEPEDIGHEMRSASARVAFGLGISLEAAFALLAARNFDPLDCLFYGIGAYGLTKISTVLSKIEPPCE
ncbi:MAG TPA: hypothetical protein VGA67_01820 [Candidatus Dojkabacteria bacterium]|jgi:hypothetical protein